jgi:hypothetical protein
MFMQNFSCLASTQTDLDKFLKKILGFLGKLLSEFQKIQNLSMKVST